jgi:DNA-binding HxlR family transcriptional regulator
MKSAKPPNQVCHFASSPIAQLHGKWTVSILCVLRSGPIRLGALSRVLPDASKKVLMAELKRLVHVGLVKRWDMTGTKAVRHVEYCLSESTEAATVHLLEPLELWATSREAASVGQEES